MPAFAPPGPVVPNGGQGVAPEGLLTVSHLSVRAGGRAILEDLSFTVRRGALVAVVGPNGGGKTTLLRALLGRVPFEGEVQWSMPVRIGYVPQRLVDTDIPLSVQEFLSMKCPGDYSACLASVGLGRSLLHESIGRLSAGEIQRVLIAWAVVDQPNVLFFDEPTSNVDVGSQEVIYRTIRSVRDTLGATVLLVTHDIHATHHFADTVLALRRRVLFFGPPDALLADDALLSQAFEIPPEAGGRRTGAEPSR